MCGCPSTIFAKEIGTYCLIMMMMMMMMMMIQTKRVTKVVTTRPSTGLVETVARDNAVHDAFCDGVLEFFIASILHEETIRMLNKYFREDLWVLCHRHSATAVG